LEKRKAFNFQHRLASGQVRDVEVYSGPIVDQGKTLLYSIIHDISKRKQNENKLKESEEFFSQMLEQSIVSTQLLDPDGTCVRVNPKFCGLFGVESQNMVGYKIFEDEAIKESDAYEPLLDVFNNKNSRRWRNSFDISLASESSGVKTTKPERVYLENLSYPILDQEGNLQKVLIQHNDITEQKQSEEQIKASLKEKETLIDEIHHRVKNNIAIIASLLKMQSNSIEDPQIKEVLKESQNRVYAMSAVHETLHGSDNLSQIDLKTYLSKVTTSIFQTYSINPDKVKLNISVEEIPISIDQANPIGLVINELISNSLKYAFPDERKGEITVSMKKLNKELELTIMDDGIGMPDELDWKNAKSLGLKLVRALVENQLDGSIDMESNNGTKFTIKFNIET
ncbi:MAG: PAS domain S-box protein, partial [Bacteroidetes bacterium]|nr:PAS domain S-box protein [Deltaproteobacteria bacterium]MBT4525949.1 PAS domain S-box protein [Deltaproteobacteria bacterium]MBT7039930.1 PAS domain S-box protein [Bacteroidota bacterium]